MVYHMIGILNVSEKYHMIIVFHTNLLLLSKC